jgi:hypothetical protein
MPEPVSWPADLDDVIRGDLAVAAVYLTPAGGAVATSVAPVGIGQPVRHVRDWQVRRHGTAGQLARLAAAQAGGEPTAGG